MFSLFDPRSAFPVSLHHDLDAQVVSKRRA